MFKRYYKKNHQFKDIFVTAMMIIIHVNSDTKKHLGIYYNFNLALGKSTYDERNRIFLALIFNVLWQPSKRMAE